MIKEITTNKAHLQYKILNKNKDKKKPGIQNIKAKKLGKKEKKNKAKIIQKDKTKK